MPLINGELNLVKITAYIVGAMLFLQLSACNSKTNPTVNPMKEDTVNNSSSKMNRVFTVDYIMGRFDPSEHKDFVQIEPQHRDELPRVMHREAYAAFVKMYDAAKEDGITLKIISATRNFDYQKGIWERKWDGITQLSDGTEANKIEHPRLRALRILEYSSMPGTSRHHWGTDIDLNDFDNEYFEKGDGQKVYNWLQENAHQYDFGQPYTTKNQQRPHGYNEEKWHWSYLPISKVLTSLAKQKLTNDMITDFKGATTAEEIDIVGNYILGIDKKCQ